MNMDWNLFWTIFGIVASTGLGVVGLIYAFLRNLKSDINEKFKSADEKVKSLDQKIDKLGEKVEDVDRRLCRIEGSLATQGHCLFNQSHKEKKAE